MGTGRIVQPSDIVEAEFETVRAAQPANAPVGTDQPGAGLGLFAGAQRIRSRSQARTPMPLPMFALVAFLSAGASFYVAGGHALFATSQDHNVEYAQSGWTLELAESATRIDTGGARPVMVVHGSIRNQDTVARPAPPITLEFDRMDGTGTSRHRVQLGQSLAPGEAIAFTSRLPAGDYSAAPPRIAIASSR